MSQLFDAYDANYRAVVQSSIDFSGLPHDFFMQAKADLLGKVLRRRLGVARGGRLLDIGCGIGTLHPYLAGLFDEISGVDVSPPCIAEAAQRCPGNSYAVAAPGTPLAGGPYDMTLAVCTLHHVPPRDWRAFVAEMARVTRPGGLVCVIEHNPLNPLTRLAVNRCPFDADAVLLRSGRIGGAAAGGRRQECQDKLLPATADQNAPRPPLRNPARRASVRGAISDLRGSLTMPMPSLRRLATFASVGAIATVAYGIIAESLVFFGLKLLWASLIAYAVSATWSYLGHKRFTFGLAGAALSSRLPRFICHHRNRLADRGGHADPDRQAVRPFALCRRARHLRAGADHQLRRFTTFCLSFLPRVR